jgi:cysteine-rich repeat protein
MATYKQERGTVMKLASCLCFGLLLMGCTTKWSAPDEDTATDTEVDTTTDTVTDTGSETDTGTGECGDGHIDDGEDCDDGGISAECNANCTESVCGDGITNAVAGEACDDEGESEDCDADCTIVTCGDGLHNATAGETCDDGADSEDCDGDCTAVECGDGRVNTTAGEYCEGGETETCDADCTEVECGDGVRNTSAGEVCDDGVATAACDTDCTVPVCGDGLVNNAAGEDCEGGESETCDVDCSYQECGDGLLNETAGEVCDDGNLIDDDVCSNSCTCGVYTPTYASESYSNNCFYASDWSIYESYDGTEGRTSVSLSATLTGSLTDIDPGDKITVHVVLLDPLQITAAVNYASVSFSLGGSSGGNSAPASPSSFVTSTDGTVTLTPGNAGYYGTASSGTIASGWYNLSFSSPTVGQDLSAMTVSFTSPATFSGGQAVNPNQTLAGGSVSISYSVNGDVRGGPYPITISP